MRVVLPGRRAIAVGLASFCLAMGAAWLGQEQLIGPRRVAIGPAPRDLSLEDVSFHSTTGATLHGWYAAGCSGHGTVLLLHGVRANRLAMLPRAQWLHGLGYGVLLIDFQASGESSGRWITFGAYEAGDAVAAIAYLRFRSPDERIAVIGTSMGGAAALLARPPQKVDAMVLEQVYPDIDHAVQDRLRIHLGGATWLAPWMLQWLAWRTGVREDMLRPIERIGHVDVPKLLVVGSADRHTRLDESMAMYAAASAPKELWIVRGAQHVDLYNYDTLGYRQRVAGFLSRWLGNSPRGAQVPSTCASAHPA